MLSRKQYFQSDVDMLAFCEGLLLIVDMFNQKARESQVVLQGDDVCHMMFAVECNLSTISVGEAFQLLQ